MLFFAEEIENTLTIITTTIHSSSHALSSPTTTIIIITIIITTTTIIIITITTITSRKIQPFKLQITITMNSTHKIYHFQSLPIPSPYSRRSKRLFA